MRTQAQTKKKAKQRGGTGDTNEASQKEKGNKSGRRKAKEEVPIHPTKRMETSGTSAAKATTKPASAQEATQHLGQSAAERSDDNAITSGGESSEDNQQQSRGESSSEDNQQQSPARS